MEDVTKMRIFEDGSTEFVGFKKYLAFINAYLGSTILILFILGYEFNLVPKDETKKWATLAIFIVCAVDVFKAVICKETHFGTSVIKFKSTPDSFLIRLLMSLAGCYFSMSYFLTGSM